MEIKDIQSWIEGYTKAWNTNDSEDIGQLLHPKADILLRPIESPGGGVKKLSLDGWDAKINLANSSFIMRY